MIKLPQLYNIYKSKSTFGLNPTSFLIETLAYHINYLYGLKHEYLFITYGENLFLTIQNYVIVTYIIKSFKLNAVFLLSLICLIYLPLDLVNLIFNLSIPISLLSKIPQIKLNYVNKSTGSLSFITTLAQFFGCLVRILTSVKSAKGDIPMIVSFTGATILNFIILLQIIMLAYFIKKVLNLFTNVFILSYFNYRHSRLPSHLETVRIDKDKERLD